MTDAGATCFDNPALCSGGEDCQSFANTLPGCACRVPDPALGETSSNDSCAENDGGSTFCDPITFHCRAPLDGEPCGSGGTCGVGTSCSGGSAVDAGATGICVRACTASTDCTDPTTHCVGSACVPNGCTGAGTACDAWATGDGTCTERSVDGGANGLCVHRGDAGLGAECFTNGALGTLCGAGLVCATSGDPTVRSACQTGCALDPAQPASGCSAGERCVPVDGAVATSLSGAAGVCLADAVDADGGLLLTSFVGDGGYPAPHTAYPLVTLQQGGVTLPNPSTVTITFANYSDPHASNRASVEAFADWIVTSPWLTEVGADYSIGFGTNTNVEVSTDAPTTTTDQDTQNLILGLIQDGGAPVPTANSAYFVYYPATTTVSDQGGTSCVDYLGYHSELQYTTSDGSTFVPYAIVPDCGGAPGISAAGFTQSTASHEFIEAATDPFPSDNNGARGAWGIADYNSAWVGYGGEVADLCNDQGYRYGDFVAQAIWSNSAVAAGGAPCRPIASEPWFGVSTDSSEDISVSAGQTLEIPLTGWSTGPVAPFDVLVYVFDPGSMTATTQLSVRQLSNGRTGTLTVQIPTTAQSGDYEMFSIFAYRVGQSFDADSEWPVLVYLP